MIKPKKLIKGDEIRVIALSRSLKVLSQETIDIALSKLTELGFKVTFSKNCSNVDESMSSSIQDRVSDLHEAFKDPNVKAIFTVIGGYNSNQIIDYLDYEIVKNNPKIFCGYSDITTLLNAFNTQAGLVTYYGPHFSSFGMKQGFEYSVEYFKKMFMEDKEFEIVSSSDWSDDLWFLDQENREFIPNEGMYCINEGSAEGLVTGGNISTFSLLAGTKYFPDLTDKIIIWEAHGEVKEYHFDRLLQQLIQQQNFSKVKGLVIGMFQKDCKIDQDKLIKIIKNKKELNNIPVIANANFGHITPIAILPIGGKVEITSYVSNCKVKIKV